MRIKIKKELNGNIKKLFKNKILKKTNNFLGHINNLYITLSSVSSSSFNTTQNYLLRKSVFFSTKFLHLGHATGSILQCNLLQMKYLIYEYKNTHKIQHLTRYGIKRF